MNQLVDHSNANSCLFVLESDYAQVKKGDFVSYALNLLYILNFILKLCLFPQKMAKFCICIDATSFLQLKGLHINYLRSLSKRVSPCFFFQPNITQKKMSRILPNHLQYLPIYFTIPVTIRFCTYQLLINYKND